MKALVKNDNNIKNMKLSYYKEITNFLSDNFTYNKNNVIKFFKRLYELEGYKKYDKLTIKFKNLKNEEGMFNVENNLFGESKYILINKTILKKFNNIKYTKPYLLTLFLHEMHHKKQYNSFMKSKICNIKEKSELDKYLFFEIALTITYPLFSYYNKTPLFEILARMETLNDFVDMIKKGVISPTLNNYLSILPASLQVYSFQYNSIDNAKLTQNKTDSKLNCNYFKNHFNKIFNVEIDNFRDITIPREKMLEIQLINFDKFYFEFKKKAEQFDDNINFINEELISKYKMPTKIKEVATNLQYVSKHYFNKYSNEKENKQKN